MDDFVYIFEWWFTLLVIGAVFMPMSMLVFKNFKDKGWIFSKVLGTALSGWLMWYLSSLHILKFTQTGCYIVLGLCLAVNAVILYFGIKKKEFNFNINNGIDIIAGEAIFFLFFVVWCYIKGFKPEAYGTTEKLMDFGFMQAMYKSDYMPPEDLWLAGKDLNYYYVGQFMATYLSKVSNVGVEYGYNLMLMMISAMGFSLPASIVLNVAADKLKDSEKKEGFCRTFPYVAAGLAGTAVSLTGNMHYVVYAKFIPWARTMLGLDKLAEAAGYSFPNYWFPNATRYIGYNPETTDKTIHEFPLYSFVLGDLHAHVVNLIFVLTVVAILYAFLQQRKKTMDDARLKLQYVDGKGRFGIPDFWKEVFSPHVLLTGFFIGLFHTTNFWDFPIYFVVAGAVILFSNARIFNFNKKSIILTFFHAVVVFVTAKLVCLPFTLKFHQIATSVRLCDARTPLYQLAILWGLPLAVTFVFFGICISNMRSEGIFAKSRKEVSGNGIKLFTFIGNLEATDMFILILGLCAFGLVLIPEVIYVKDIYSGDYKRANTMFKLTYQAYILFGMTMGYVLTDLIYFAKKARRRVFGIVAAVFLIMTVGYFGNSTKAWFGDLKASDGYEGLDCGEYLLDVDEDDYYATNWINSHIEGRPVMLEANGSSYTDYNRVSVRTGLPTLLGWQTHEWLWQSDETGQLPEIVKQRGTDIETIYTSDNISTVRDLIDTYNIEYIYVGGLEREKYGEVNHELLQSMGEVVYPKGFAPENSELMTYIIKIK